MHLAVAPLTWEGQTLPHVEYLTAAMESGRRAIQEVMRHSYADDIDHVPPLWTMARVVDGVPVSYIQVDPDRRMDMPHGELRYAFLMNVATRQDRRRQGHFRAITQHAFSCLRDAGIPVVVTHGRYPLYRPLGFEVFTHHSGIFTTPETIERKLGRISSVNSRHLLTVCEHRGLQKDLLLITEVRTKTIADCAAALQAAAALARAHGKARILFEEPSAPGYGSRYPIYHSPETPFMTVARAGGAEVRLQGANPEEGSIPDADWIQVLDAAAFVGEALQSALPHAAQLPRTRVSIATESGTVTVDNSSGQLRTVVGEEMPGTCVLRWPAAALAQLVTGYRSVSVLSAMYQSLPMEHGGVAGGEAAQAITLLDALFPTYWRFSRNESWVFSA